MPRSEFPKSVRRQAFERAKGRCQKCTAPLFPGRYRYNHILPDALGGKPVLDNCEVLCLNCDAPVTYEQDIPRIAKADRARAKIMDGQKRKSRPIPGSRGTRWKRKLNGTVVER